MSTLVLSHFFSLESVAFPGYYLTQDGTQVLMAPANPDNPFQIWYKDETWRCIHQGAYAYINHGSKLALKPAVVSNDKALVKVTVGSYDPAVHDDSLLWDESKADNAGNIGISSRTITVTSGGNNEPGFLSVAPCVSVAGGAPALLTSNGTTSLWKVVPYVPNVFSIISGWVGQILTYKQPHKSITFKNAVAHDDEHTVVGVHPDNASDNALWYRIPAGGAENTTFYTSFVVINKGTGLALKGSTKPGDKTMLTPYNVLDNDFVWSEGRVPDSISTHVCINLSTAPDLRWNLSPDSFYQNSGWYHPLTLMPGSNGYLDRQAWSFKLASS